MSPTQKQIVDRVLFRIEAWETRAEQASTERRTELAREQADFWTEYLYNLLEAWL